MCKRGFDSSRDRVAQSLAALLLSCATMANAAPVQVSRQFQPPSSWAELAEAVKPAVVSVRAVKLEHPGKDGQSAQDPFSFFFDEESPEGSRSGKKRGDSPAEADDAAPFRSDSGGSGFLISADGLVVTNHHVIEGATRLDVVLADETFPAEIVGTDPATDLALLAIESDRDLPYLQLGDSDALRVGDWVMVVGNPLNLDLTVTSGVVSATGRSIGISGNDAGLENFIQTEAPINFGNSGGPVVDMRGRVVAIATAVNFGADNIGFLVPSNTLRDVLPQLKEYGDVSRGALGTNVAALTPEQAPAFGVARGVVVTQVPAASPAAAADMRRGDVVVAVEGAAVASVGELVRAIASHLPGSTVTIDVVREGRPLKKQVVLAERLRRDAGDDTDAATTEGEAEAAVPAFEVVDLDAATRKARQLPADARGAIVTFVDPLGWLHDQGLRRGQRIIELNGKPLASAKALNEALAKSVSGTYLRLLVLRERDDGVPFFVVFRVP